MNIIKRGQQFLLAQRINRAGWEWRRCPRCGDTLTCKWRSYQRRPWFLTGRQQARVQGRRRPHQQIRVGLAVQVLPLANSPRIAEEAAMVDHISAGRLVFGVGRSSFLESCQGYNVDYAESRGRFAESLEIILKAWDEESFS